MYKVFSKVYDKFMEYSDYDCWEKMIEKLIVMGQPVGKKLLDIGCGTGELLTRMCKKYECSGMDISEEMLKVAHKKLKNKDINLFLGDMVEFDTGEKYDIMISIFDTVNHILSVEELEDHFCSIKKSLNKDGIYIFDVVDREFMNTMFPAGIFVDNRKDMTVIWEHEIEEKIDYIDATYFVKNIRGSWDKLEETYVKKIFTEEELKKSIEKNGLELVKISINEDIAGKRYFYLLKNNCK